MDPRPVSNDLPLSDGERKFFESLFNDKETTINDEKIYLMYQAALRVGQKCLPDEKEQMPKVCEGLTRIIQEMYTNATKEHRDELIKKINAVEPSGMATPMWLEEGLRVTFENVLEEQYKVIASLKACEKAKAELLLELKENMKISDRRIYELYFGRSNPDEKAIVDLLKDYEFAHFKSKGKSYNEFDDKPYKDALAAYKALDDMSKILEQTDKSPRTILIEFDLKLKESPLVKMSKDSTFTKIGKIILGLFLALSSIIGVSTTYNLTKTRDEKVIKNLDAELKEMKNPFTQREIEEVKKEAEAKRIAEEEKKEAPEVKNTLKPK